MSKKISAEDLKAIIECLEKMGFDVEEVSSKKNFEIDTPQIELAIRAIKSL